MPLVHILSHIELPYTVLLNHYKCFSDFLKTNFKIWNLLQIKEKISYKRERKEMDIQMNSVVLSFDRGFTVKQLFQK